MGMSSLIESLNHERSRRLLIIACSASLALGLIGLLAIYLKIETKTSTALTQTAVQVMSGVVTGIISATFLVLFFRAISGSEREFESVRLIDPSTTAHLHQRELVETTFWYHDGHIGRWVRAAALAEMARRAKATGVSRKVTLLILDPSNDALCEEYGHYRQLLDLERPHLSHAEDAKAELIATALASTIYSTDSVGLSVRVYFKSTIEYSRIDIGSTVAFRTLIDPRCNAVAYFNKRAIERHSFYDAIKLGFEAARKNAREFRPVFHLSAHQLTLDTMRRFIVENNLVLAPSDELVELSLRKYLMPTNPFR